MNRLESEGIRPVIVDDLGRADAFAAADRSEFGEGLIELARARAEFEEQRLFAARRAARRAARGLGQTNTRATFTSPCLPDDFRNRF